MKINEYRVVKNTDTNLPTLSIAHTYETSCYDGTLDYNKIVGMMDELFEFSYLNEEYLYVISMDFNGMINGIYEAGHGNCKEVRVFNRELFTFLLLSGAERFIVLHNHPCNIAEASEGDIEWTNSVDACAKILNIELLASLVVTQDDWIEIPSLLKEFQ